MGLPRPQRVQHRIIHQPLPMPQDCIYHNQVFPRQRHHQVLPLVPDSTNGHSKRLHFPSTTLPVVRHQICTGHTSYQTLRSPHSHPRHLLAWYPAIPPYSTVQQNTQPDPRVNPPAAPRVIAQRPRATAPPTSPVHTYAQYPRVDTPATPPVLPPKISIGNQSTKENPLAHRTRSRTILPAPPPTQQPPDLPISHRTRAHTTGTGVMDFPVLDEETGQLMEYCQLRKHPNYTTTWTTPYSNEMGRLCHGIGRNAEGTVQRVDGTDTYFFVYYNDIPAERLK